MTWYNTVVVYLAASFIAGNYFVDGCSHGSTMMIENPGAYTTVFATNHNGICTTSWTEEKTHVFISDCETDDEIVVVFDNMNDAFESAGTRTSKWTVTIRCHHSPETDVETEIYNTPLDTNNRNASGYSWFG